MAYLIYTINGPQIIYDEEMDKHKQKNKSGPNVLAHYPLTEDEAKKTLDELMLIYPQPKQETKNGNPT